MKAFQNKLYKIQDELWNEFLELVKVGASLPAIDVRYPLGNHPKGLAVDSDQRSYFLAMELIANPNYTMHIGKDIIVATETVEFIDSNGKTHRLEPDVTDLHWMAELIDSAIPNSVTGK